MADCTAGITAPLLRTTGVATAPTVESSLADAGTLAFRVAMKLLRHREDAEDVAQEACVRALERFPTLRDRTRFQSWLVRVAWRLAIDRRRSDVRRGFRHARVVLNDHTHATAEQDLIARERERHLQEAIDRLPDRLRQPLVLSGLDGHSVDEIAQRLQLPAGTIKSRSFEARRRLRRTLTGAGLLIFLALGVRFALLRVAVEPSGRPVTSVSKSDPLTPAAIEPASASSIVGRAGSNRIVANAAVDEASASLTTVRVPVVKVRALAAPETDAPDVVGVPVVKVPFVKVPVVEIPVVNGPATTSASGHLEKPS